MTVGYDMERLRVALEAVDSAAAALARHKLPDWLQHRLAHIRSEGRSLLGTLRRPEPANQEKGEAR